jgi:hypothetical protein
MKVRLRGKVEVADDGGGECSNAPFLQVPWPSVSLAVDRGAATASARALNQQLLHHANGACEHSPGIQYTRTAQGTGGGAESR